MLLEAEPSVTRSISATTRAPRPGETEGKDYYFVSPERFRSMIHEGAFLEWAEVHGDSYGTPRAPVENLIIEGRVVLMVIDVKGGQSVRAVFPEAALVYLAPPGLDTLEQRLRERGTESEEVIRHRLNEARMEMKFLSQYTYRVVNRDGEQDYAVNMIRSIISVERCRIRRMEAL
jgi:guanylate kinase